MINLHDCCTGAQYFRTQFGAGGRAPPTLIYLSTLNTIYKV